MADTEIKTMDDWLAAVKMVPKPDDVIEPLPFDALKTYSEEFERAEAEKAKIGLEPIGATRELYGRKASMTIIDDIVDDKGQSIAHAMACRFVVEPLSDSHTLFKDIGPWDEWRTIINDLESFARYVQMQHPNRTWLVQQCGGEIDELIFVEGKPQWRELIATSSSTIPF